MCIDQFSADCISKQISVWESITSNPEVFQTVKEMSLEFEDIPLHYLVWYEIPVGHKSLLKVEVKKLLKKRAVFPVNMSKGNSYHQFF